MLHYCFLLFPGRKPLFRHIPQPSRPPPPPLNDIKFSFPILEDEFCLPHYPIRRIGPPRDRLLACSPALKTVLFFPSSSYMPLLASPEPITVVFGFFGFFGSRFPPDVFFFSISGVGFSHICICLMAPPPGLPMTNLSVIASCQALYGHFAPSFYLHPGGVT